MTASRASATKAKAVMVLGTTSGAGKSLLATALCRWYARQGLKVAPFKAQNMSNNARVVPGLEGPHGRAMGEIGSAQYFQALAARARPDVRMNPVLIKPEHDRGKQVVILGEVRRDLAHVPWHERGELLWPHAREALQALMAENEVVVIEGAGSPSEINSRASDYANLLTAREAHAACMLVTDIDRGGTFAHLYGTHQLLPPEDRALIRGFVLNRFCEDAALLPPCPAQLQALTGVPTLAVLPMWSGHGLPDEDWVSDDVPAGRREGLRVVVIAYPRVSNLDEFQPLRNIDGVHLILARDPAQLEGADWIILPGSKHTSGDLAWLRAQRFDAAIARHASEGRPVLGLCGGLQMLGEAMVDTQGVDGSGPGLGLLPLATYFAADKILRPTRARFTGATGAWATLEGVHFEGYEIHHGRTVGQEGVPKGTAVLHDQDGEAIGWQHGAVLGMYAHGLFESSEVLRALFGASNPTLDSVFDGLADFVDDHFEPGILTELIADSPRRSPVTFR